MKVLALALVLALCLASCGNSARDYAKAIDPEVSCDLISTNEFNRQQDWAECYPSDKSVVWLCHSNMCWILGPKVQVTTGAEK